ncbi:unnamed protein product [Didymodactylos carnosus]|uniref:Methyltransferase type 11 domain-containing protein n=1 Tax=Didymodactylos carnosus TaxID=1234261 RepID=A0A813P2P8_9BILA|nr:unnamed protein product [Didymodactylos carnosus]CAF0983855.1 unnamed protein product [Didymodactylos carnosus]CAF3521160.1 unnamed protein product [Didymodactylos carnosus]CAF3754268.1 unnamed protein product [Didymodactylos carnosus]
MSVGAFRISPISPTHGTLLMPSSSTSTFGTFVRETVSNLIAPFRKEYKNWPWTEIAVVSVACVGSYTIYKLSPVLYQRFYMYSTAQYVSEYNKVLRAHKEKLFSQLETIKSSNSAKLNVVEIGVGSGANFPFYPRDIIEVVGVDPNREWESYLTDTLKKNRHVTCPELLVGNAENISVIRESQVDAVVSTLTLSCVKDVDQVCQEVRRILKPGGLFLYLENIRSENIIIALIQALFTPFYKLFYGMSLIRSIPENIERAKFTEFSQQLFYANGITFLMAPHVVGIAKK